MEHVLAAPAFIINLDRATDRLEFATRNIGTAGFSDIRRFRAIDGCDEAQVTEALERLGNPVLHTDDLETPGKMGCLLSHLTVLKTIVDQEIELATIFEDDVLFHPDWATLSGIYFEETPADFDVIFMGNSVDSLRAGVSNPALVLTDSCYSTHSYVVTLTGAKRLLDACLNWRVDLFNAEHGKAVAGLMPVDILYKYTQILINTGRVERLFTWYCWNGTVYPCEHNIIPLSRYNIANSGLVFQALERFETTVGVDYNNELNDIPTDEGVAFR
jgi:GR25 family glycosyltransferase involved in LPS biosynthesis